MQMYGLHFYGIAERHDIDKHRVMEKHGDLCDMNDFMHDNSPYLANYVRPLLMGTPEVASDPSPSREATVDSSMEHMQNAGERGGSLLGFDEFGSNVTLVLGGGLRVTEKDFAEQQSPARETAVAGDNGNAGVPMSKSPEQKRKFKGKEIVMESGNILFDLSDMSDSYSDMKIPPFDEGEVELAGTSGEIWPPDHVQPGPTLTSTIPAGPVIVKQERTGFWEQRDMERAQKQQEDEAERARVKAMEEELQLLRREMTSLRSLSQVPTASQDTMSDAQIVRPTPPLPLAQSFLYAGPCSQVDLRVKDIFRMSPHIPPHENLSSPPLEHHCSTFQAENVQPVVVQSSSPPAAGKVLSLEIHPRVEDSSLKLTCQGNQVESAPESEEAETAEAAPPTLNSSAILEIHLRVEDSSLKLNCQGNQVESALESEEPETAEAAPPTLNASPIHELQVHSTSGEVEEDVDYGDGLDDSEDVQVFKVQSEIAVGDLHGSRADQGEKVFSPDSSDPLSFGESHVM